MTRYLSLRRNWPNILNILFFGFGLGWCQKDKTACLMLHFFTHILIIGPHLSAS